MGVKLFVGNLSYSTTEQELKDAFSQAGGTVNSVRIAIDRATQRPRGFAFVELATDADADKVIKAWNGQMLGGRNLFVEKAQERVPGAPRPAPRARGFGGPGGDGAGGGRPSGGSFGSRGPGGGPGAGGPGGFRPRPRFPIATAEVNKEEQRRRTTRPEKRGEKKRTEPTGRPEERERGKWRWDGSDDY